MEKNAYVYDGVSGALRAKLPHEKNLQNVRIGSGGTHVVTVEENAKVAHLWSIPEGGVPSQIEIAAGDATLYQPVFSPDGMRVALSKTGGVQV